MVQGVEFSEDREAIRYAINVLPKIKNKWKNQHTPIEFIQQAGDTVFIPPGWWHCVVNLDETVSINQVLFHCIYMCFIFTIPVADICRVFFFSNEEILQQNEL